MIQKIKKNKKRKITKKKIKRLTLEQKKEFQRILKELKKI